MAQSPMTTPAYFQVEMFESYGSSAYTGSTMAATPLELRKDGVVTNILGLALLVVARLCRRASNMGSTSYLTRCFQVAPGKCFLG